MNFFKVYFLNIYDFAHILQILIVLFSIVAILTPFKRELKDILIKSGYVAGVFLATTVIELLLFGLSGVAVFLRGFNFSLTYLIVIFVYTICFCKFKRRIKILVAATSGAATIVVTEFIKNYSFTLGISDIGVGLVVVVINLLNLLTVFLLNKYSIGKFRHISSRSCVLGMINAVAVIVLVLIFEGIMNSFSDLFTANMLYSAISGTIIYIMLLITYLMLYFVCEKNESNLILKQEQRMWQDSQEMLKITQKTLFDMRTIVHDTKNTYSYILMLLEEGKTKELKSYLNSISGEVLKSLSYIEGSNSVVVNILNMERAKAEAHGFKLKTVLNVPPALPYGEADLCSIFTNLIDNAIEACERYKFDSPEIYVVAAIRQDYLYIEVTNPLPEGMDVSKLMLLNTTKGNSEMHGFGTKIVKKIADKYDGYVNFEVDGNNFIVEVMLGLMVNSNENV